jgi:hypothetical protein
VTIQELTNALVTELDRLPASDRIAQLNVLRRALTAIARTAAPELVPREKACHGCGFTVATVGVPEGWLALSMRERGAYTRHGLFCTPQCLGDSMHRIVARVRRSDHSRSRRA